MPETMNPIADIPDNQLSHKFWTSGKEQAICEKEWEIADHQRLVLLAELTKQIKESEGISYTAAENEARTSTEYKDFLIKRGEIKEKLVLARTRKDAVKLEINLRISKDYTNRQEYNAGKLNT